MKTGFTCEHMEDAARLQSLAEKILRASTTYFRAIIRIVGGRLAIAEDRSALQNKSTKTQGSSRRDRQMRGATHFHPRGM